VREQIDAPTRAGLSLEIEIEIHFQDGWLALQENLINLGAGAAEYSTAV
jgi:hypothetical protein